MKRILIALISAVAIGVLMSAFAGRSAAAPVPEPAPVSAAAEPAGAILVSLDAAGEPIAMCLMPGDTMALRAGIGAAIGALAGLPIFIIGAIPAALIGAGFGALSWIIADHQRHLLPGPCD